MRIYDTITEFVEDLWHFILRRPILWEDAEPCEKIICRFCGGRTSSNVSCPNNK